LTVLNLSPLFCGERSEQREALLRVRGKAVRGPDRKSIRIARRLRVNQTDAETVLWNRLRNRQIDGHKFVRQQPIVGYICDFACREKLLVIEVDGGQHNGSAEDIVRDRRLADEGYKVLRFWNDDVLGNIDGVLSTIQSELRG
jgi:very-short-patch-repair endonuclease